MVELLRFQQVASDVRVQVYVCGPARPAFCVFEPGFEVVDLLEPEAGASDGEALLVVAREPVRIDVLDWRGNVPGRVTADDVSLPLDVAEHRAASGPGPARYRLREAIDVERFSGARANLRIEASDFVREVTLSGDDVEAGEFTLEDELRVATAVGSASRLGRVLPFFGGHGDFVLPKLGEVDAASRRRMDLGRVFERADGWRPVLVDFVNEAGGKWDELESPGLWRAADGSRTSSLLDVRPSDAVEQVIARYGECREALLQMAKSYVRDYTTSAERPFYVVAPNYVERDEIDIEGAISQYLEAYSGVLDLLGEDGLSPGEVLTLACLDSVALDCTHDEDSMLDLRLTLLGPWHPLVVAKRFMVQHWIYAAAKEDDGSAKEHRRLATLFEGVDGFRVVPGFDPDSLNLDVALAFPTSDPGWHLTVASGAFSAIVGSTFRSLRGFGERLGEALGLRSTFSLAGADLWSERFARSFQRSYPSRRQLGLRVGRGLDAGPVVESCVQLLGEQRTRYGQVGALLPGGIHVFLEERLRERQPLQWQQPGVLVYEALDEASCYENFHPDILLLPQREDVRLAWLPRGTDERLAAPRGLERAAVFSMPLVDLSTDRQGLPVSRMYESCGAGESGRRVAQDRADGRLSVGAGYRGALVSIDALARRVRQQPPAVVQELGLSASLRCDWTVLPGAHVDAGALSRYVAAGGIANGAQRALWDYRLDVVSRP